MATQEQKTKFICPLFRFEIVGEEENKPDHNCVYTEIVDGNTVNTFKRLKFIGNSTLRTISRKKLSSSRPSTLSVSFLQHIPQSYFSYGRVAVIEIFEQDRKIASFLENIETALRLYKDGDVFCKVFWSGTNYMLLDQTYEVPNTIHSQIYELKKSEIKQVNEIFSKLQIIDFEKEKTLKVAINRLNRSYGKSMPDEKIVDFMIGFEALLVKEESINPKQSLLLEHQYCLASHDMNNKSSMISSFTLTE